jgi:hypothetical protein
MTDQDLSNDGKWQNFLFLSAATFRQLLKVLPKEIKERKD